MMNSHGAIALRKNKPVMQNSFSNLANNDTDTSGGSYSSNRQPIPVGEETAKSE